MMQTLAMLPVEVSGAVVNAAVAGLSSAAVAAAGAGETIASAGLNSGGAAYVPFMEPLPMDAAWIWFAVPLVLGVAVVYKTLKLPDLKHLVRESLLLATQVLFFLVAAAVGLSLLTYLF